MSKDIYFGLTHKMQAENMEINNHIDCKAVVKKMDFNTQLLYLSV